MLKQAIFSLAMLAVWCGGSVRAQESQAATIQPTDLPLLAESAEPSKHVASSTWTGQHSVGCRYFNVDEDDFPWLQETKVGYDGGFVIAGTRNDDLETQDLPFELKINGWGQLRHTIFDSDGPSNDLNQFQLKRARLVFSGSAFTKEFNYFIQLDGRSTSGDDIRLLDYFLRYDIGHKRLGLEPGRFGILAGRYKVPFNLARWLSGREFEFTDRSVSSIYFDVNRSLATSLYGNMDVAAREIQWEVSVFNGLVSGGAETGSSGALDNNFAVSGRLASNVLGEWGGGQLADFDFHRRLAARVGCGFAFSEIDRQGSTEFSSLRVVDSGLTLASLLPAEVESYKASLYAVDTSIKFRGFSSTLEYYFRLIDGFSGAPIASLFDHGLWFQMGYFVVPERLQLLTRWSRVQGNSGTLGQLDQSDEEISAGLAYYARRNNAKLVLDMTFLDGAPINSSVLDITPRAAGLLIRSQLQFAF